MASRFSIKPLKDAPITAGQIRTQCPKKEEWSVRKAPCAHTRVPSPEYKIKQAIVDCAKTPGLQRGEEGFDATDDADYLALSEVERDFAGLRERLKAADPRNKYGFATTSDASALYNQIRRFVIGKMGRQAERIVPELLQRTVESLRNWCLQNPQPDGIVVISDINKVKDTIRAAIIVDEEGTLKRVISMMTDKTFDPIAPQLFKLLELFSPDKVVAAWPRPEFSTPGRQDILNRYVLHFGTLDHVIRLLEDPQMRERASEECRDRIELLRQFQRQEALGIAKALRGQFRDPFTIVEHRIVFAYADIAKQLTPAEFEAEVHVLREKLKDHPACGTAGRAYGLLAAHMPAALAAAEAKALRKMFDDPSSDVRAAAMSAYGSLAGQLTPEECAIGAKMLREKFADRAVQRTAVDAYLYVVGRLTPAMFAMEAQALQEMSENSSEAVARIAREVVAEIVRASLKGYEYLVIPEFQ